MNNYGTGPGERGIYHPPSSPPPRAVRVLALFMTAGALIGFIAALVFFR